MSQCTMISYKYHHELRTSDQSSSCLTLYIVLLQESILIDVTNRYVGCLNRNHPIHLARDAGYLMKNLEIRKNYCLRNNLIKVVKMKALQITIMACWRGTELPWSSQISGLGMLAAGSWQTGFERRKTVRLSLCVIFSKKTCPCLLDPIKGYENLQNQQQSVLMQQLCS